MDEDKSTEAPEKTIEYGPMAVIAGDTSKPAGSGGRFEKFKKKPVILLAILLLLAVLAAAYFLIFAGKSSSDTPPPEISRIGVAPTVVDGEVTHLSGGGERTLTVNSILSEGDSVRTAGDGRVVLTFDDGSALRLDASTEVRLVSLAANDVRVEHLEGAAYSRVVASGRSYSVDVDGTAFVAEGTAYTTHNTATTKGVQVVQSSVKVAGADESVEEGKQYFKAHQNSELIDKQTDINLEEFKNSSFVLWNMEQDEKSDLFKDKLGLFSKIKETSGGQSAEEDVNQSGGIKLVAKNDNKGTVLSWSVSGLDASGGFMIVRSKKSSAPVYGQDESIKVDHKTRSYTWKSDKEGVFWYRVCVYKDKKTCVSYSNAVEMKAVYVAPEPVVSGSVTLTGPAEDGRTISWAGFGGTAPHGFKVLISTGANPTYPSHAVDLVSGTSYTVKDKYLQSGVNYVRVCKYTAGSQTEKCVDYSNSVTLTKSP